MLNPHNLTLKPVNGETPYISNQPPCSPETLLPYLQEENFQLTERASECLSKAKETPDECADDETESLITDRIGAIQKCAKDLDARRVSEKNPYLSLERAVDSFFNPHLQKLDLAKKRLSGIGGAYKARKAEAERQHALEEANRKRLEREEAERKALEEAKIAQDLREAAEKARQEGSSSSMASELDRQANAAEKSSTEQLNQAVRLEKAENKATAVAEGRKAPSSTTSYGAYGSRGGLRTSWKGQIADRTAIDPAALMPFVSDDEMQKALNRWIDTNAKGESEPKLEGAKFWREEKMQVRA